MPAIVVLMPTHQQESLLGPETLEQLARFGQVTRFEGPRVTPDDARRLLAGAEIALTTWGSPKFDAELLAAAPRLKLIVYGAGSIRPWITDAVWDRGVRVCSCAAAIANRVAEYTVGLAIIGLRGAVLFNQDMHANRKEPRLNRELWGATVGVVSLGQVGRKVVECLKPLGPRILAFDPFVAADAVAAMGATKMDLASLLRQSDLVTLHAPALPETRHMLGAAQLKLLKDGAVLVNTSRGSVIDEAALIAELRTGRISAMLDVTDPEPPAPDSPLRQLPNVFLTPHVAGGPTRQIGRQCLDEIERFVAGRAQVFEVTRERLASLA